MSVDGVCITEHPSVTCLSNLQVRLPLQSAQPPSIDIFWGYSVSSSRTFYSPLAGKDDSFQLLEN